MAELADAAVSNTAAFGRVGSTPTSVTMRYCQICKQEIEKDRAEGVPDTRLCIQHANEIAKYGGEFTAVGTQSSLSKTGSLKKNYGDVGIERHRNHDAMNRLLEDYGKEVAG